ncbi:hypothetical protein M758_4G162500 [Ceratodon purpureus]|nr:hypothetical protein M758_4G162500 [Ceratodon purpureus]
MSVLANKGRKTALQGLERVSADVFSQNLTLHRLTSSRKEPFLGVIICGTGFSREVRKQVQIATECLGGQYSRDLHLNCTHLLVQNCSGRKYEHAVKHGVHRGLHIVSLSWFEDCVKQNARLDESLYTLPSTSHQIGAIRENPEYSPEDVGGATQLRNLLSADYDMEATVSLQRKPPISLLKNSGGTQANRNLLSGVYRSKPQASPTIENSSSLAGARFYIDPDLRRDLKLKAKESAESWGATCVINWSKATHVVCESESISKYIGLNLHLVSPMWVMSARDGLPLRCVQYSADLARDVGDLLLDWKTQEHNIAYNLLKAQGVFHNGRATEKFPTLQEREIKASAAKAGVRRRRGPQMQSWRTRPRLQTLESLLESIYWIVTDTPTSAQVYTQSSGKRIINEHGKAVSRNIHHSCRYHDSRNEAFEDNIYTKPLSRSEKREVVFPGSFLTILFPIDRFSELGPSSRTFFSDAGFTRWQIIQLVYTFYQEPLDETEVDAALHTDSKHGDRLRASFQNSQPVAMPRHQLLGTRVQFHVLQRTHNADPCSHIYDLCLGTTSSS